MFTKKHRTGLVKMTKTIIKRYSTAFKQQVVKEYEKGTSISTLRTKYGINGNGTVDRWVKEYGQQGLRHQLMVIQSPEEQDKVKELKEKIAQLEKAVAQLTLDKIMLESTLEIVEEELGEIPKKSGEHRSSSEHTSEPGNKEIS
jgi:transposase-like protein